MNLNQAYIALSSQQEISQLEDTVELGLVKDLLDSWSFITINVLSKGDCVIFILGNHQNGEPYLTSAVVAFDYQSRLVKTTSGSIYQLGEAQVGDPSTPQIMCLCAMLHNCTLGEYLGVPHFFY